MHKTHKHIHYDAHYIHKVLWCTSHDTISVLLKIFAKLFLTVFKHCNGAYPSLLFRRVIQRRPLTLLL